MEVSCAVRRFFKSLGFKGLKLNRLITLTKYKKTHIPINAKNNQYVNIGLPFLPSKGSTLTLLAFFQAIAHYE